MGAQTPWVGKNTKNPMQVYGGFHKWGYPKMIGLFHGKSEIQMDDESGYPYDLGNLHMKVD